MGYLITTSQDGTVNELFHSDVSKVIPVNAIGITDAEGAQLANGTLRYFKLTGGTVVFDATVMEAEKSAAQKEQEDISIARSYAKLKALSAMSPAQVQTWVQNNVTNLAQAQDAIATLAIAVSILARRL